MCSANNSALIVRLSLLRSYIYGAPYPVLFLYCNWCLGLPATCTFVTITITHLLRRAVSLAILMTSPRLHIWMDSISLGYVFLSLRVSCTEYGAGVCFALSLYALSMMGRMPLRVFFQYPLAGDVATDLLSWLLDWLLLLYAFATGFVSLSVWFWRFPHGQ